MKNYKILTINILICLSFFSCKKDDDTTNISDVIPTTYDTNGFAKATIKEQNYYKELKNLTTEMSKASDMTKIQYNNIKTFWDNLSLKNITSKDFIPVVDKWLQELADASGNTFQTTTAPNHKGGLLFNRMLNENGVECKQIIEKGLYHAAMYYQAIEIMKNETENISHKLVAIFGGSPLFSNTDNSANTKFSDYGPAKYAARRTSSSGGFYLTLKKSLINIKYYLEVKKYTTTNTTVKNEFNTYLNQWEKALIATSINYLYGAITELSETNFTDEKKADALHKYAEAISFIYGFNFVSSSNRIISDVDLKNVLKTLYFSIDDIFKIESYKLLKDQVTGVNQINIAIQKLADIYNFSKIDLTNFKLNYINEENR